MYRNKTMKIAPPAMLHTSNCGERAYLRSRRTATAVVAAVMLAAWRVPAAIGMAVICLSSDSRGGLVLGGLGRYAGHGQEDLVQGRAAKADVVDLDAELAQHPDGRADRQRPSGDREGEPVGRGVEARP